MNLCWVWSAGQVKEADVIASCFGWDESGWVFITTAHAQVDVPVERVLSEQVKGDAERVWARHLERTQEVKLLPSTDVKELTERVLREGDRAWRALEAAGFYGRVREVAWDQLWPGSDLSRGIARNFQ